MDQFLLAKEAQILAIKAELLGMESLNNYRISRGETIAYDEDAFCAVSFRLMELANVILNA